MYKLVILIIANIISLSIFAQDVTWETKRITATELQNESNTWVNFMKDVELKSVPNKAIAQIACDSKYWLWINGEIIVFEGELKRGPTPDDTYYDKIDIAPFLKKWYS